MAITHQLQRKISTLGNPKALLEFGGYGHSSPYKHTPDYNLV